MGCATTRSVPVPETPGWRLPQRKPVTRPIGYNLAPGSGPPRHTGSSGLRDTRSFGVRRHVARVCISLRGRRQGFGQHPDGAALPMGVRGRVRARQRGVVVAGVPDLAIATRRADRRAGGVVRAVRDRHTPRPPRAGALAGAGRGLGQRGRRVTGRVEPGARRVLAGPRVLPARGVHRGRLDRHRPGLRDGARLRGHRGGDGLGGGAGRAGGLVGPGGGTAVASAGHARAAAARRLHGGRHHAAPVQQFVHRGPRARRRVAAQRVDAVDGVRHLARLPVAERVRQRPQPDGEPGLRRPVRLLASSS